MRISIVSRREKELFLVFISIETSKKTNCSDRRLPLNALKNCTMRLTVYAFVIFSFFVGQTPLLAQFEVTNAPPITPQNLITNIFLGDGVQVLSVVYEGSNNAVGFFKEGQTAVGMERGIVMTTGRAVTQGAQLGVQEPGNAQASVDNMSTATDPDLLAISGGTPIFNVSKYIITFIPISDTLRFRYAFGSEEYPEYVCSEFNDIFGFFISGPGISGPYQNGAQNIALIPGTNLPVRINNVNSGQVGANGSPGNCMPPNGSLAFGSLYRNNNGANTMPVYDGLTHVFTAEAVVQPCQVYTIKLVICDVQDAVFDSGVFLEAKSFGTGSLNVETTTVSLDGSVAEGCAAGRITFSLPNPVESDYFIDYRIFGDAINGVDIVQLPDSLFIPAGQNSVTLDIIALEDGLTEGSENLYIDVQRDVCTRDTFLVVIRDNPLIKPDLGQDLTVCAGTAIPLDGTIPIVLPPPPSFSNTNNLIVQPTNAPVFSNINVSNVIPNVLGPQVLQSICLDSISHPWIDDLDIFLITPGGQFLELTTDNGGNGGNGLGMDYYIGTCFTPDATVRINSPGPFAPPSAVPFTGNWLPEGVWSDIWGGPVNGQWRLQLLDDTNGAVGTLHSWTITFNRIYNINYVWSPTIGVSCTTCPDPVVTPVQSSDYVLTASDSYGCTISDTIFIETMAQLAAPVPLCGATTDDEITVVWQDVPGATGYEINVNGSGWTTPSGNTEHTVSGLTPGEVVSFAIRSTGLCPGPENVLNCTALPCSPPDLSAQTTDATCAGLSDGAVALSSPNATGALTFELNGATNSTGVFSGLPPGLYVASMTDDDNCPATVQFTITAPQALGLDSALLAGVRCFGESNGAATVSVNGGQLPYQYEWDNGETTAGATALSAGPHSVTVTDAAGCAAETQITIPEPDALDLSITVTAVTCPGAADGSAQASAVGGNAGYSFEWNSATGNQTGDIATGLAGGAYTVVVTDANGCMAQENATVPEAAPIQLQILASDALCFGEATGSASIAATGGNGGFTFTWSNGQTGPAATGLIAGTYTAIATDMAGCRDTIMVAVGQPASALSAQWQSNAPACFGSANGSASVLAAGGTPGYTIQWTGLPPTANPVRMNMAAGTYPVTLTDGNGCTVTNTIVLTDPPILNLSLSATNALCFGAADGTATALASGGTGALNYQWSNGQTGATATGLAAGQAAVTVTDANGCEIAQTIQVGQFPVLQLSTTFTNALCNGAADGTATALPGGGAGAYSYQWSNGQTTAVAGNLAAGSYTVIVRDANNCQVTENVTIGEPTALGSATQSLTASCSPTPDGQASVSAQGGTPPYTYRWSDPAQQSTALAVGLLPGAYSVTVTDANGCTQINSTQVASSPPVSLTLQSSPVSCFGGSNGTLTANASGGTGAFIYSWSGAGIGSTANPTNLPAGVYSLTVTDAQSCRAVAQIEIVQPAALLLSAIPRHIACAGNPSGSIDLTALGGTPPYRYAWSNGVDVQNPNQLSAGFYTVTVTDGNDCTATLSTTIVQTTPIAATFNLSPVDCFGASTGAATVTVNGGAPPFQYEWSNNIAGSTIQNVPAGDYTVAVTDSLGCRTTFSTTVPQPDSPLDVKALIQPPTCFGEDNGRIELELNGGTPGYVFSLNGQPFVGNRIFIALSAGAYNVTVRDSKGCLVNTGPLNIDEPERVALDLGPDVTLSYGDSLHITPIITGTVDPVLYEWLPKDSLFFSCLNCPDPVIRPLFQRAISLRITDANGCTAEDLFTVFVVKDPRAFVPTGFTPNGDGMNDRLLVHGRAGTRVLSFRVFDRWGQLMYEGADFEVNDPTMGWDGTFRGQPVSAGVYVWSLTVVFQDDDTEVLTGETTVIR